MNNYITIDKKNNKIKGGDKVRQVETGLIGHVIWKDGWKVKLITGLYPININSKNYELIKR